MAKDAKEEAEPVYDESSYKKLEFPESIRKRPGMYVGKLGNGKSPDDGIYLLTKEAVDNGVDEYQMGHGKKIIIRLGTEKEKGEWLEVEDFGRGIPLGVVKQCASEVHGGSKFDGAAFKKSVGMNGVGLKAVNALSEEFELESVREKTSRKVEFAQGIIKNDETKKTALEKTSGTRVRFRPDGGPAFFQDYHFEEEYLSRMAFQYACLNAGLEVQLEHWEDGRKSREEIHLSKAGLPDFLTRAIEEGENQDRLCYPPIQLVGDDVEVCLTHGQSYGEEIHSFVNGQNTREGGTHVAALREGIVAAVRDFSGKTHEPQDIRGSLIAVVSIRIQEPLFESQTKTKLGSTHTLPMAKGTTIKSFVGDFVRKELDNYLRRNPKVGEVLVAKVAQNERERKDLAGIKEKSRELAKKANLANKKLRDCRIHLNTRAEDRARSTLFITEGDSASGSITQVRDANTQAVFSLKGKPANVFGKSRRAIYENEELHLLQSALGIEEGLEGLRYNNIVIATDADVDGMHIRLLLALVLMQFFPELIREEHVSILQTPLFRVRNRKETRYCYSEDERVKAIRDLGPNPEITRFKGLGEISPSEFKAFIGPKMRIEPLTLAHGTKIEETLRFCLGPNTPERQKFLCENLDKDAG
jgi:topoisomerase-4 subunit B